MVKKVETKKVKVYMSHSQFVVSNFKEIEIEVEDNNYPVNIEVNDYLYELRTNGVEKYYYFVGHTKEGEF